MTENETIIEETDKSYLAGLFDGEECIIIDKSCTLSVIIGNTDEYVITYVHNLYGGSLQKQKRKGNYKQFYRWVASGTNAYRFLKDIYKYLIIKKLQSAVSLEYYKEIPKISPLRRRHGRTIEDKLRAKIFKEYLEKIR